MSCTASTFTHRVLRRTVCVALLLMLGHASVTRANEWREVKEPHYGEVLFYFYQQKYLSALSHLMTAQHFERLGPHAGEAELLRGGMLLSYGQHVEAGRIFEQLIEAGAPQAIRDRVWFYLAKIRYQRGYLAEAEQALAHIEGRLPGELEDERLILHAFLLMGRKEYRQAADLLAGVRGKSDWTHYGRYNLGVALIKAGETEKGVVLLEQVGRAPVQSEELKSLRDKANVALGFTYLQDGWPELARTYLERVRLDGLMSNKALLGMGWAYSAREQQDRALVHWTELHDRNLLDAAVQESLMAVPYALGKLGAYQRSLEQYEAAIGVYTREMTRLDKAIAAIRAGKLGTLLLADDPIEEMGWFWKLDQLPDTPESHYLAHLMAGHDFQEALKNYRDLRVVSVHLDQWTSDIGVYHDMLATRRNAFANRLPAVLKSKRVQDLPKLAAARDRYAEELARIERDSDTAALATEKEQELLARLERIRQRLSRQVDTSGETQERYRLLRGLLNWDIATDFSSRIWQARKALNELDRLLHESEARRAALEQAQQEMPRRFEAFDVRIRALTPRIVQLRGRAQELARAQEAHLGELAVAELRQQHERLATYLTQARFAVAQMYDQSSSGHAQGAP
jgi:hypothetical protein